MKKLFILALLAVMTTAKAQFGSEPDFDSKYATELVKPGTVAPDFRMKTIDGQPFQPQLEALSKVGLGYLHLNQAMTTLSGGELQRVKLADNLHRSGQLYIIDEPTDGLHLDDIQRLMTLFDQMADRGNTLILIEHSLDMMRHAD